MPKLNVTDILELIWHYNMPVSNVTLSPIGVIGDTTSYSTS